MGQAGNCICWCWCLFASVGLTAARCCSSFESVFRLRKPLSFAALSASISSRVHCFACSGSGLSLGLRMSLVVGPTLLVMANLIQSGQKKLDLHQKQYHQKLINQVPDQSRSWADQKRRCFRQRPGFLCYSTGLTLTQSRCHLQPEHYDLSPALSTCLMTVQSLYCYCCLPGPIH